MRRWTAALALVVFLASLSIVRQGSSQEGVEQKDSVVQEIGLIEFAQTPSTAQPRATQPRTTQPRTTQPPRSSTPRATTRSRSRRRSSRLSSRRRSMSNVPNMFGDFFGGSTSLLSLGGIPMDIQQIWSDGDPFNLIVRNGGSPMFGADIDFATPIQIEDENRPGLTLARSIMPGTDASGDGSADTYEIDEPLNSAPVLELGGGTITFLGGQAVFVGIFGPNQSTTPADNSIGQPDGWNLVFAHRVTPNQMNMLIAPGGGSAVRRQKVSENNSPIPRDRLIFNHHFFNNVRGGIGDVNRYTVGWESTLLDGDTSFEFRLPFAGTLSSEQTAGGITARDTEIGNLSLIFKHIVLETDDQVWAMGLGINAPTARHTVVRFPSGATAVRWRNDAVHLLPYIGAVGTPNDQVFWQGFLQLDLDTAGNRIDADATGMNALPIGVVQDPNILFADFSIGTWLYDDPDASFITGIAPLFEMHYATTLQDADTATGNGVAVSSLTQRFDVLNLSAAAVIRVGDRMTIRPGIVVPVRRNHDKQFDYEAGVQINIF